MSSRWRSSAAAVRLQHGEEALQLRPLVAAGLVHVDQVADLGEREAQALAAQRELEARALARGVDAALAVAPRREQALGLVEADGARRDVELRGQLADRILRVGAFLFDFQHGRVRLILAQVSPRVRSRIPARDAPAPGTARQVAPGVHWLRMALPFALDHINLWLLEDEGGWTLVDTGLGDAPTRALWEEIFAGVFGGRPVRRVLVTHYHPDHAGNAGWLCARFAAPLWMTQAEYLTAHAVRDGVGGYVPGATLALFRANGLDDARHAQMATRGNIYRRQVPEFPDSYRRIMDGERIAIGAPPLARDHGLRPCARARVALLRRAGGAISGDMLLPRISTNVSVWPVDPDGDPLGQFLQLDPALTASCPPTPWCCPRTACRSAARTERVRQLEEHHEARLAELMEACAEAPRSAAEVVEMLFRRKLDTHQMFFAMGEAIAHLHYLERAGGLRRTVGADGVARFAPAKEEAWKSALTA